MKSFRWPPPPDGGPRTWGPTPTAPRTGRPTLPAPPTEIIQTPSGVRLEQLVSGVGDPVTVFAHGLAGDITGTRPLGSAVAGRRVFFHFRGHGRSDSPPGPWSFADLAADLRAVADRGQRHPGARGQHGRGRAVPAAGRHPGPLRAGGALSARAARRRTAAGGGHPAGAAAGRGGVRRGGRGGRGGRGRAAALGAQHPGRLELPAPAGRAAAAGRAGRGAGHAVAGAGRTG